MGQSVCPHHVGWAGSWPPPKTAMMWCPGCCSTVKWTDDGWQVLQESLAQVRLRELEAERDSLRRAIVEHRTAIHNAGNVRVIAADIPAAKRRADKRLWKVVEGV